MIKMLNEYFEIGMETMEMEKMASVLGSDCSFFIQNIPQIVTGTGEIMEEIDFQLPGKYLVILKPNFSISTKDAYHGIDINEHPEKLKKIIRKDHAIWKKKLKNEFESKLFKTHPEIADIKNKLYESGAVYASMSGSGSAVFGLFSEQVQMEDSLKSYLIYSETIK